MESINEEIIANAICKALAPVEQRMDMIIQRLDAISQALQSQESQNAPPRAGLYDNPRGDENLGYLAQDALQPCAKIPRHKLWRAIQPPLCAKGNCQVKAKTAAEFSVTSVGKDKIAQV